MIMKKKISIAILILIMSIGFATISTTLIIKGTSKIAENIDDFDIYFSAAELDGEDVSDDVIDSTGKVITYTTSDLVKIGDKSVLVFDVTNASKNYDADVEITCDKLENANVTVSPKTMTIEATSVKSGTITVELNKNVLEEINETFKCTLNINASERISLGSNTIKKYNYRAKNVSYDNTRTGLTCTNMQECIEEINEMLEA